MIKSTPLRFAPAIIALCGGLALAACGGDETAPAKEAPSVDQPSEATPRAPSPETPNTSGPTSGPLPLTPGVYVSSGTRCAQPSNAGFRIYNGQGISGSATRDCRITVRSSDGDTYQVDQSCTDTYSGERTTTAQTIRIPDARSFTLTEGGDTGSFRLCAAGEAPDYLEDLVTP